MAVVSYVCFAWLAAILVAVNSATVTLSDSKTTVKNENISTSRTARMTYCRPGWQQYQGSCYRSVTTTANVNWHEAQTVCNDNGGHLPTISSEQENTFVYNMYSSHCIFTHRRYLGFHDGVNEGHFKWVDDSTSSYTKWRTNQPDNGGSGEDCTHMYGDNGEWNDIRCTDKYFNCFLCEDTQACPHGWVPFGGSCFRQFHHASALSWHETRAKCRTVGADLVSVNCEEDQRFLDSFMSRRSWYYIGFTDVRVEGTFRWSDGSTSTYTKWLANEPNNAGSNEDCTGAVIGRGWNDVKCHHQYRHYYACEMN
ncbi:macrophage mannose receptor 1-like [Corticium candelabrum]|uniref:macrophage mannose receptor 1-like n=1 Tax=Corticium candelabrum TaxID=121492 RepID=UPI002E2768FD|nr:macrophage mannose receptor 1-like [Corticium candelabrum]